MYFSHQPREIATAAKINIVCNYIKEGMFLRTTFADHLNVQQFNPAKLPQGNFFFLLHFTDQFDPGIVLNQQCPENLPGSTIKLDDPETWGPTVAADSQIPQEIVELIIKKRVKILGHHDHVNVDDRYTQSWVSWICERYPGLTSSDFVFLMPCTGDSGLRIIDNTMWAMEIVRQTLKVPGLYEKAYNSIQARQVRKHKFISLNARPTVHRQIAAVRLFNYRQDGILTFSQNLGSTLPAAPCNEPSILQRYEEIQEHFPLVWDIKENNDYSLAANLNMSTEYIAENLDTYLNIVTETRFYNTSPVWFSEKTFRAMMFLQPFVVIGARGALRALRNRGYKTFGTWIDESYDDIEDAVARAHHALDSAIEFFSTRTQEELSEVMVEMAPLLMHNYYHLLTEYNNSSATIINRLLAIVNEDDSVSTACNALVYNADKIQHGITAMPFALPDFARLFNAVSYSEHTELPESFYFQLDRVTMDLAWEVTQGTGGNRTYEFQESIDNIPVLVYRAVLSGRAKFIIYDWGNLQSITDFKRLLHTLLQALGEGFSENSFVIVSNFGWQESQLNFVCFNFWEAYYTDKFNEANPGFTARTTAHITSRQTRTHKFICLNGQYTNSRLATATLLADVRDQGILSLINSTEPLLAEASSLVTALQEFGGFSPELAHQFQKDIQGGLPWHWPIDLTIDYSTVSWAWAYDLQRLWAVDPKYVASAVDCYLNIVTEANHQPNGMLRHTEKIFKAINLMQPFIVIGEMGQISSLQTQGYKTFGRWIDESYDSIEDPALRVFAATEAAREFIAQDLSTLADIMVEMLPVLLHNKKLAQYRQRTCWARLEIELARALLK